MVEERRATALIPASHSGRDLCGGVSGRWLRLARGDWIDAGQAFGLTARLPAVTIHLFIMATKVPPCLAYSAG